MLIPRLTRRRLAGCALLALAALAALAGGAWCLVSPGRLTRENFDRIHITVRDRQTGEIISNGTSLDEVEYILGPGFPVPSLKTSRDLGRRWSSGLNFVHVHFQDNQAVESMFGHLSFGEWWRGRWFEVTGRRPPF
jgi:hypothetical protein